MNEWVLSIKFRVCRKNRDAQFTCSLYVPHRGRHHPMLLRTSSLLWHEGYPSICTCSYR